MINKVKELLARWKVQVSFVAGCLVVATTMGTCSFDPSATGDDEAPADAAPASTEAATEVATEAATEVTTGAATEHTTTD